MRLVPSGITLAKPFNPRVLSRLCANAKHLFKPAVLKTEQDPFLPVGNLAGYHWEQCVFDPPPTLSLADRS